LEEGKDFCKKKEIMAIFVRKQLSPDAHKLMAATNS
jgi:hypothetical protein